MSDMKAPTYALVFTYKSPIFGKGFIADVQICGRLLAEIEAESVWLYGVNPGGFAVTAPTLAEAGVAVTTELSTLLVDFVEEIPTFEGFRAQVQRFFDETDTETVHEWEGAVEAVRKGLLPVPPGLAVQSANPDFRITVTSRTMTQVTPNDNASAIAEQRRQQPPPIALARAA